MKTKNAATQRSSLGGKVRSPAKTEAARRNAKRSHGKKRPISFQARSNEIHDSLDNVIKKVDSGEMNPESAKEMLEKIKVVQTLLRAAKRELEGWLKGKKL
jgi:hypothetical protein